MRAWLLVVIVMVLGLLGSRAAAADNDGAEAALASITGNGGSVAIFLVERDGADAVLGARFSITLDGAWHFYDHDLPAEMSGFATRFGPIAEQPIQVTGPVTASVAAHDLDVFGATTRVYPDGPVTLRLPVRLPAGDGAAVPVQFQLQYQVCNEGTCQMPVRGAGGLVTVALPSDPAGVALPSAGDADPEQALATLEANGGAVSLHLVERTGALAVLEARYTITLEGAWHFYDHLLPAEMAGFATQIEPIAGAPVTITGPLEASAAAHDFDFFGATTRVFPDGPVTLRVPVQLPAGDGGLVPVQFRVQYQVCNEGTCQMPVRGDAGLIEVLLPSDPAGVGAGGGSEQTPAIDRPSLVGETGAEPAAASHVSAGPVLQRRVSFWLALVMAVVGSAGGIALLRAKATGLSARRLTAAVSLLSVGVLGAAWLSPRPTAASGIAWLKVDTPASVEAHIAAELAAGNPVTLDFTGPSCVNCQAMLRGAFTRADIASAWNRNGPVEIDTDAHPALATWQRDTFQTDTRPLYVRLSPAPAGSTEPWVETRWNQPFAKDNEDMAAKLVAFLDGGAGNDLAAGADQGWWAFIVVALAGGLFTLVMPCTYPMIPFTVTFFSKQSDEGRSLAPLAAAYALGIIGFFVAIGVVVAGLLGGSVAVVAGHWITNLLIGVLFIVFGLSLLGAFLLRLPAGLEGRLGGARGGYFGALAMGATFAITAFTCTAPFAGLVLAQAVTGDGSWTRAVIGMAIYASAIAVPFFFLAISPGLLQRLPKAGGWMSEFKVVGGLVELGAAAKFLAIVAVAVQMWTIGEPLAWVTRDPVLALWAVLALVAAAYVAGWLRLTADQPIGRIGGARVVVAAALVVLAMIFVGGLFGNHLGGTFEAFFPGAEGVPAG